MSLEPHAALRGLSCAALVDALGRLCSHRADLGGLVSPTPGRVLFGPAVTVAFLPRREDLYDASRHSFATLYHEAVGATPAGKVLVLASGGHRDVSLGGGTKLSRAHNHGLAGVLADGALRDFDELARYTPAFYCRGEATRAGGDTVMPFEANVPVELGGVAVVPGDYVYADASGGVVIPAAYLDRVLAGARAVEQEDARTRERIRVGERIPAEEA